MYARTGMKLAIVVSACGMYTGDPIASVSSFSVVLFSDGALGIGEADGCLCRYSGDCVLGVLVSLGGLLDSYPAKKSSLVLLAGGGTCCTNSGIFVGSKSSCGGELSISFSFIAFCRWSGGLVYLPVLILITVDGITVFAPVFSSVSELVLVCGFSRAKFGENLSSLKVVPG